MKFKLTVGAFIGFVALAVSIFFAAVIAVIDYRVTSKLDGVLWTVPAKIYSRPLELAEGFNFNKNNLIKLYLPYGRDTFHLSQLVQA